MELNFTTELLLSYQKAALMLALIMNAAAAAILIKTWKHKQALFALLLTLIATFCWTGSLLTTFIFSNALAAQLAFFFGATGVAGLIWFALAYPSNQYNRKLLYILIPVLSVALLALVPDILYTNLIIYKQGYLEAKRTGVMKLYGIILILSGIAPAYILHRKQSSEQNTLVRQRPRWISTGICASVSISLITNVILPTAFKYPYLNSIGPISTTILAVFIVWLVLHQHFVDSKHVRAIILGRLALGAFVLLTLGVTYLFFDYTTGNSTITHLANVIFTTFVMMLFGKNVRLAGEYFVLPEQSENPAEQVRRLIDSLTLAATVQEIEEIVSAAILFSTKAKSSRITLSDNCSLDIAQSVAELISVRSESANPPTLYVKDALNYTLPDTHEKHRVAVTRLMNLLEASVIIPITHKQQVIGILSSSEKSTKLGYTHGDASLLASLAHILPPFLIRASIIKHNQEVTRSLEKTVKDHSRVIVQIKSDNKEIALNLTQRIKQPLNNIRTAARTIENHSKNTAEVISAALEETETITKGLIEYTKAQGAAHLPNSIFNLSEIVGDIATRSREAGGKLDVQITTEIQPEIYCHGNATSVYNGIVQIVNNAFRYIGDDKKEISISLKADSEESHLLISNTGKGIPKDLLGQVTAPFSKMADNYTSAGVDLAIARSILNQNNVHIEITSKEGVGTTVTMTFKTSAQI